MHVQGLKKRHIELVMSLPFLAMLKSCARIHLPPGGALGVLPAIDGCFSGELIFMLALPFGAAAGDERKNSGDEDAIFWRAACDVPCDWGCCDRRGAGEDIVANVGECLSVEVRLCRRADAGRVERVAKINLLRSPTNSFMLFQPWMRPRA